MERIWLQSAPLHMFRQHDSWRHECTAAPLTSQMILITASRHLIISALNTVWFNIHTGYKCVLECEATQFPAPPSFFLVGAWHDLGGRCPPPAHHPQPWEGSTASVALSNEPSWDRAKFPCLPRGATPDQPRGDTCFRISRETDKIFTYLHSLTAVVRKAGLWGG